ncbi:hypothetical protein EHS25_008340 [Saitozyma podzolica]|uniref:Uncharacterized protein n=1 Tax=Saitozyma podzolica TaxID=1890683 RepID=A0A427YP55_9TREE|nr:hypothetical protein EHS25_008340 [Saitozyma podzolica]
MNAPSGGSSANGINGPLNPFVVTPPPPDGKEDEIPGYVKRFGAYHTLTEGVFLPAGTLLPKGCNFAMQSTVDFGLHFPRGSKVPGGFLLPVSVVKKEKKSDPPAPEANPLCLIQ